MLALCDSSQEDKPWTLKKFSICLQSNAIVLSGGRWTQSTAPFLSSSRLTTSASLTYSKLSFGRYPRTGGAKGKWELSMASTSSLRTPEKLFQIQIDTSSPASTKAPSYALPFATPDADLLFSISARYLPTQRNPRNVPAHSFPPSTSHFHHAHFQVSTSHDSTAWTASKLGAQVDSGELPAPYFLMGDNAFVLSNSMVVPSGTSVDDAFDHYQSSQRMPIECSFGILVRRWGVLWRALEVRFDRRAATVGACMRLHNFCINHSIGFDLQERGRYGELQPGRWDVTPKIDKDGRPVEYLRSRFQHSGQEPQPNPTDQANYRRIFLKARVQENALQRPAPRTQVEKNEARRDKRARGH